ncbi:hypothetical protein SAMN04487895_101630 [Paenibacillus sophorae]|uniref:Uncharacterized protein n=1 Tax=Paenibacillus sophorae TaxID=1333845 RepID=A0A1H8GSK8_9BACL|nr:hypothetical protein SAMN04487895_101630 [Paenibacillus sophorae]
MKLINHLTKEEIKGIPSRKLISSPLFSEINRHVIVPDGNVPRYYLITGYVIDTPNYYVLYELTKKQYDKRLMIHEVLI